MSLKRSIVLTIGIVLAFVAVIAVAAAMFAVDQGEEMLHLYKDYQAMQQRKNAARGGFAASPTGMELRGHWYGMSLAEMGGPTAAALGVPPREHGLAVAGFTPGSGQAAQQAGLRPADVITGVDGQEVKGLADLHRVSHSLAPNTPVMLDVQRQGQTVTLVLPPHQPAIQQAAFTGPQYYCPRDGLLVPGAGGPAGPGICPRCNGPLHLYHPNAQAAFPAYQGIGNVGVTNNGWVR